jgi:Pvc16 N-terminal domain/Carboxypeptidase regulatory-like domain
MIDVFDNLLRHLFLTQIDEITDEGQVRFEPPDDDWRKYVKNLTVGAKPANSLNVYLADIRENRILRSTERVRNVQNFTVTDVPYPRRIDLHYLISAWSPATASQTIEPTLDELALLYKVIGALMNAEPFDATNIYSPNPLPAGFPQVIADVEIPTIVLPVDGFPKIAEFWGTFGTVHPWKPMVYFVATLPVVLNQEILGPMVTSRITEYRLQNSTTAGDTIIEIGGTVRHAGTAVVGAWVRIEDALNNPITFTTTDENGRFLFGGLHQSTYVLRVRAQGFSETTRTVDVPSATGNYDVQLP